MDILRVVSLLCYKRTIHGIISVDMRNLKIFENSIF